MKKRNVEMVASDIYHKFQTGQITLEEYLKTQELPSETINRINKAIKEDETNRKQS